MNVTLELIIKSKPHSVDVVPLRLKMQSGETQIPLVVIVEATGFEFIGKYFDTISVPVLTDSEPLVFMLKAKNEGFQTIVIRFYQNGTYSGQLKILSEVHLSKAIHSDIKSAQGTLQILKTPAGPDMTLFIIEKRITPDFEYVVIQSSTEIPMQEMGPIR